MARRLEALSSSFAGPARPQPQRFAASFEAAAPAPLAPPPRRAIASAPLDRDLPAAAPEPAAAASFRTRLDRTVSLSATPGGGAENVLDRHHDEGQRGDAQEAPVLEGVVLPPRQTAEPRAASLDEEGFERAFAALMAEAQPGAASPPRPGPAPGAPAAALPDDDPHEIFNRMGRSMQFANTFNLGRIDIDRHFDALERSLALGTAPVREPSVFALSDEELADDISMTSSPAEPAADRAAFVQGPASGGPGSRGIAVAPPAAAAVEPAAPLHAEALRTEVAGSAAPDGPQSTTPHEMEPVAPV